MGALSDMVRQGKALYVGISNYQAEEAQAAIRILRENKNPLSASPAAVQYVRALGGGRPF